MEIFFFYNVLAVGVVTCVNVYHFIPLLKNSFSILKYLLYIIEKQDIFVVDLLKNIIPFLWIYMCVELASHKSFKVELSTKYSCFCDQ